MRVYAFVYNFSCEEAKYLTGVRREKESFERLIKERGVSDSSFCFKATVSRVENRTLILPT